ncbi:MAG: bifunctional methylenetetrahydrofolate dehydrogenase/methenyltetrahydrofolate cyclohydrolase FolD [Parachlamydiaceae bacterium]|nr:bifunctional methylenetetrahydrofolate dehydrogenase/methenyltetrahydrofolate cyclohydrolase FolD [Parachlamydiaceae bacterium]
MKLIEGKKIAENIQQEIKALIANIDGRKPCLAVIQVGDNVASQIYVSRKIQACKDVGMISVRKSLPPTLTEAELIGFVDELNNDTDVDGILVQLPLPHHINAIRITQSISPEKDVDGFHPYNVGRMLIGETDIFFPCTPLGIKTLLERYSIEVAGKHVVVVGRSNIVGKPIAAMLMQGLPGGNATVTIAHRFSKDLHEITRLADILIVAIGKPKFISAEMIKPGVVIIDVGINRIDDSTVKKGYQIVGDVDFEAVKELCSFITPVPGGVGPMTIAMLLKNTLNSYYKREGLQVRF